MDDAGEEGSPLDHILNALLNEAVRSRMRNRALLRVLVSKGALEMHEYVDAYRAEEEENFGVLVDMLMMAPDDFHIRHAKWLENDRATFGYRSESYPTVHLNASSVLDEMERDGETPAVSLPKPKKKGRARKNNG